MKKLQKGSWGVVVAVGGALAITAWYDHNPVLAALLAVGTAAGAVFAWRATQRPRGQ
ncbi:MAG TPA: hypothetical protein VGO52_04420 [Hyphomonadaceae bacterium]|jgi:hypothetical protein|nr:hypothetical protein [Hyphomonadaceae bacterium]